jgi:hypothetical protein
LPVSGCPQQIGLRVERLALYAPAY